MNQPGTAIGDVLSAKLPLINQSLSQILNVASSVASKIQTAITSPAGAIQQLNNVLANAFGLPTPSAVDAETQQGTASLPEVQTVHITADDGTFTLTFTPSGGSPETTTPLAYNADPSAVQTALNKLQGVHVTVTGSASNYTISFTSNGQRPVFVTDTTELARGPPILQWNNGEIDFTFDLGTSVSLTRPFDLDLSSITASLPGALAGIANALIGASASGSLTVNASANLHVALGLDLGQPASLDTSGGTAATTLKISATGGTFTVTYDGQTTSAVAFDVSGADLQTALEALTGLSGKVTSVELADGTYTIVFDNSVDLTKLSVDGGLLTGTQDSFFIKTGPGDDATHLDLTATAAGQNLDFEARIGPFGLFVENGSASLGGTIRLNLLPGPHNGNDANKLFLVSYGDGAVSSDLGSLTDFIGANSVCLNPSGGMCSNSSAMLASATLPLFVGTDSFKIPINDPILSSNPAFSNNLVASVTFSLDNLVNHSGDIFSFTFGDGNPSDSSEMPWANFSPQLPSLFALLADPSVVVNGLDSVLQHDPEHPSGPDLRREAAAARQPAGEQPGQRRDRRHPHRAAAAAREPAAREQRRARQPRRTDPDAALQRLGPGGIDILEPFSGTGTNESSVASDIHFVLMNNNRQTACAFGTGCKPSTSSTPSRSSWT